MSIEMQGVLQMMKTMGQGMFSDGEIDVEAIRSMLAQAYSAHVVEEGVSVELLEMGGVEAAIFTPDEVAGPGVVYYVHGGGLVTGDRMTAGPYSSQLALACGRPVVSCSYRLAPENPFPAGLDDTVAVYRAILEMFPGQPVCVTGESGGAHLSLSLALACKRDGLPMPAALVLDSVMADPTGEIIKRVDSDAEYVLSVAGVASLAKMYCPGDLARDPLATNIQGDFAGLPPMRIVYDKGELLAPDSVAVATRAIEAGISVEVEAYEGCFHAFTTTGKGTPESARELALAAAFMVRHMSEA